MEENNYSKNKHDKEVDKNIGYMVLGFLMICFGYFAHLVFKYAEF